MEHTQVNGVTLFPEHWENTVKTNGFFTSQLENTHTLFPMSLAQILTLTPEELLKLCSSFSTAQIEAALGIVNSHFHQQSSTQLNWRRGAEPEITEIYSPSFQVKLLKAASFLISELTLRMN